MKRCVLAAGLAFFIIAVIGCSFVDRSETVDKPRLFGATYMTRNNPFFDVLNDAIAQVVEGNGDILISRDPCQDQEKQNGQIQEMIDEGIGVLFLNPVDWEQVRPALLACKEAGVVVINIDTVVKDREYVTSIIETDNYRAGVLCAQDMMEQVDEAEIVVIDCPWQASISNRIQGFLDTIDGDDNYRIVYTGTGYGELEVSAKVMQEVLSEGVSFNVVLGGNDPSALGALATLQQHRREDGVLIYGIDGSPDFKAMLKLGYVTGTSAQSPETIGRVAAEIAYKYLNGEEVPEYLGIEPYMITGENLDQYEVNGWQ